MDDIDRKLVSLLSVDGRRSVTDLAREVGLTEGAVRRRMRRLEEQDVLQIVAVVNPVPLGFHVQTVTGLRVDIKRLDEVAAALRECPETRFVSIVTGSFDIMFVAWFVSLADLRSFFSNRLARIEGIMAPETFITLEVVKGSYNAVVDFP